MCYSGAVGVPVEGCALLVSEGIEGRIEDVAGVVLGVKLLESL